jgi:hypothetical protein
MDSENKGMYAQESDRLWAAAVGNNIDGEGALILAYESGRMSMCEEWHHVDMGEHTNLSGVFARWFAFKAVADLAVDEEASA